MSEGSVVIVTGGSQGIGLAVARDLVGRGMRVVIADLANAQDSARSLQDLGRNVRGLDVDVSDAEQVEALVSYIRTEFGAIHALVNNAGIYSSLVPTEFESLTAEDWRRVFDVNVIGLFLCCKAVMPAFRGARQHCEYLIGCCLQRQPVDGPLRRQQRCGDFTDPCPGDRVW